MPKYLVRAKYTADGLKALMEQGAAARAENLRRLAASQGATVEGIFWAFGGDDVVVLFDAKDNATAAAGSMAAASTGDTTPTTTVLLSVDEMDAAINSASAIYEMATRDAK